MEVNLVNLGPSLIHALHDQALNDSVEKLETIIGMVSGKLPPDVIQQLQEVASAMSNNLELRNDSLRDIGLGGLLTGSVKKEDFEAMAMINFFKGSAKIKDLLNFEDMGEAIRQIDPDFDFEANHERRLQDVRKDLVEKFEAKMMPTPYNTRKMTP